MAHPFNHGTQIDASHDKPTGERVTQIVPPKVYQTCSFRSVFEPSTSFLHRLASTTGEYR
jgi:hypothetical protein